VSAIVVTPWETAVAAVRTGLSQPIITLSRLRSRVAHRYRLRDVSESV
jgi:hypothetical protein